MFYKKCIAMPDYPAFGEDKEDEDDYAQVLEYRVYSRRLKMNCYSTNDKEDFLTNVADLMKETNDLLYKVSYIQADNDYICLSRNLNVVDLLPYESLDRNLFARLPIRSRFVFDNDYEIDITNLLIKVLGPNLNFHADLTKLLVCDLFNYLYYTGSFDTFFDFVSTLIRDKKFVLEIHDNLGDTHTLNYSDTLTWNPTLITRTNIALDKNKKSI